MVKLYYANGHGEQIVENNVISEFVLPEGCFVITTTVCGKTADVDATHSMNEVIKPEIVNLLRNLSKETGDRVKYELSYVFAMSGITDDIHIRYPGDKVADILFYPSPYHSNESLMELPPGLLDVDKLAEKPNIIQKAENILPCSDDLFYATTYPPKFDCSGMTLDIFDKKLAESKIPISKLITNTGPGVYLLPICRVVSKEFKTLARKRRTQSFGGKKTKRIFRDNYRKSYRKRRSTLKRRAVKQ